MYLTVRELRSKGFRNFGWNVLISDKCSIYGADKITIGNNVRIDDFCVLSAGSEIIIGDNIHIACYSSLIGKGRIVMKDYSGVSNRCSILSSNADYSNLYTSPNVPHKSLDRDVILEEHSLVGSGSLVLPGVTLHKGAVLGAMSMAKKDIPEYEIWAGVPCKFIKKRNGK